jgi:signal transduction histidine kinase
MSTADAAPASGPDAESANPPDGRQKIAQLERQVAELTEAVSARDEFLAIAAHELRNPMTPIIGQIHILLRAARSAEPISPVRLLEGLERLDYFTSQFVRRATTLLDVARFNAGKHRLEPEEVNLSVLLASIAEGHALAARHARSPITLRLEDDVRGLFDRLAVEQIVDNLVSNAIRYGAGAPIELGLWSADGAVGISVRDGGPGISYEQQSRIFGKFERIFGRREGAGFGVGLWIVRRLVESMGGKIDVDSRPGHGAAFTVVLPLAPGRRR